MSQKKYYNIYHVSDIYDGGHPIQRKNYVGLVQATDQEIRDFLAVWNKPRAYYHQYDRLYEHLVIATPVAVSSLSDLQPYDPRTRDWPDIPYGMDFASEWDEETKTWTEPF